MHAAACVDANKTPCMRKSHGPKTTTKHQLTLEASRPLCQPPHPRRSSQPSPPLPPTASHCMPPATTPPAATHPPSLDPSAGPHTQPCRRHWRAHPPHPRRRLLLSREILLSSTMRLAKRPRPPSQSTRLINAPQGFSNRQADQTDRSAQSDRGFLTGTFLCAPTPGPCMNRHSRPPASAPAKGATQ